MGLTAAEAFMLISFILLLLLTWRILADGDTQEELGTLREFGDQFTEEEKYLALKYRNRLLEFQKSIHLIDTILEQDTSVSKITRGLELESRFGNLDPDLMDTRLRLMDQERLRMLLESVQDFPEDDLQILTNMASTEDLARRLQEFEAFKQSGLTPEEVRQLQDDAEHAKSLQRGRELSRADIASQLHEKIGTTIAPLGGRILDNGDVIFPDRGLFEVGSAKISPEFETVLQGVCRHWFEVLYSARRHLDTVQIEGHASSEYRDLDLREAFYANLDLSQARASAVFKKCLDFGGGDHIADWIQSRLVAIGFSSARPVTINGAEDRRASRRVEFAIGMKAENDVANDSFPPR